MVRGMSYLTRRLLIGCGATLLAGSVFVRAQAPMPAPPAPQALDFTRDIQPIFEQYCAECHGPTTARARLRLHAPQFIRRGGHSGAVVTPGKSGNSLLIHRVLEPNTDDRMPLDADPLPEAAIARLRAWIDQGAPMPDSPAGAADSPTSIGRTSKPVRPDLPAVTRGGWVRTPIDRFVLARLERESSRQPPRPAAPTLLRRVTLDLTGLPADAGRSRCVRWPTRRPDAYERVVDRLLASPHYGERWARPWLDLARYADTNGYEKDNRRAIWKYRDWVIDALNRDLPFDTFTIEQIAGDMLPDATTEQKIATGFHRNAMTNEEGGVDPEESTYEVLVDRVNTTATVWLGTTLACAQCHNHKYDPFSQKDYFRFLAFFANGDFESRTFGDGTRYFEPTLDLATADQEKARKEIAGRDRSDRSGAEDGHAGHSRRAGALGANDPLRVQRVDPTRATSRRRHQRRRPERPAGRIGAGLGSESAADVVHVHGGHHAARRDRASGSRPCRIPSLPRGGPGRDGYGHFRVTGIRVEAAPIAAGAPRRSRIGRFETIKVDDSAYAVRARRSAWHDDRQRRYARKSGSWAINAMRAGERLPAPRRPGRGGAVRLSRRHAHHGPHRSARWHDRTGHRPFPLSVTDQRDSARGRRPRRQAPARAASCRRPSARGASR